VYITCYCFWNNLHQVRSKPNHLKIFESKKTKGPQQDIKIQLSSPMYAWGGEKILWSLNTTNRIVNSQKDNYINIFFNSIYLVITKCMKYYYNNFFTAVLFVFTNKKVLNFGKLLGMTQYKMGNSAWWQNSKFKD
jgi:hypothetical protein